MKVRSILRLLLSAITICCFIWLLIYAELGLYLVKISYGQINILLNTEKIATILKEDSSTSSLTKLSAAEKQKLLWVEEIKKYSVDSLGYKPTNNFTTYFNQHNQPILWIVTACKPFAFEAYEWSFPIVGKVSYKGFFNESVAEKERFKLYMQGYDADISEVSAWSTLGWLPDPVLSSMLSKSKGRMANLFFHELFHATYYAPSSVDVNENLANFIARKATLRFLKNDTAELTKFVNTMQDDSIYNTFVFKGYERLKKLYAQISPLEGGQRGMPEKEKLALKEKTLASIYRESFDVKLHYPKRYKEYNKQILFVKNSFFIDAHRYDGLSDSLNEVFNKKYGGDIKKMIADLKK